MTVTIVPKDRFYEAFAPPDEFLYAPGANSLNWHEMKALLAVCLSLQPKTVVEFGVADGHVPISLLTHCPSIDRYLGIDVPDCFLESPIYSRIAGVARGGLAMSNRRFFCLVAAGGTERLSPDMLPAADLIIVDADHSYEGVVRDTALARQISTPRTVIVWHDYWQGDNAEWPGIRKHLDEISEEHQLFHIADGYSTLCFEFGPEPGAPDLAGDL